MDDCEVNAYCLRPMSIADLSQVLGMRNRPEIRRYMFTQQQIGAAEHLAWFQRETANPGTELLVLDVGTELAAFVQFKQTSFPGVSDWGFYVNPGASRGTGRKLGFAALDHIFFKAKHQTHKVCGLSLSCNLASIEFHKALGFLQEGILNAHYFDGEHYHDVYCFGLNKDHWCRERRLRTTN